MESFSRYATHQQTACMLQSPALRHREGMPHFRMSYVDSNNIACSDTPSTFLRPPRIDMTIIRAALLGMMLATASSAHAIRCEGSGKTLYTEDSACPDGYGIVDGSPQGSVSVLGKSEHVRKDEASFLSDRELERKTMRGHEAKSRGDSGVGQSRAAVCESLADQARSVDATMEQPNDPHALRALRKVHRNIRDEQQQNDC